MPLGMRTYIYVSHKNIISMTVTSVPVRHLKPGDAIRWRALSGDVVRILMIQEYPPIRLEKVD